MDLLTFLISVTLLGFVVQIGEMWMVLGATAILVLGAKDFKASMLLIISVAALFFVNGIGMKEYWPFAVFAMLILGYLLGLGKEEAPADPYAGLMGGMEGGMV